MPESVDDDLEGREILAAARIVEEVTVEEGRPIVQYPERRARCDLPLHDVVGDIGDAITVHRRVDYGVGIGEDELTAQPNGPVIVERRVPLL